MLHQFIRANREELIARARAKVASRSAPRPTEDDVKHGVPKFLAQLEEILDMDAADSSPDGAEMELSATQHGGDLLRQGFSVGQVVHDYGDVCQAVTELAVDRKVSIATSEFRTLNRCLDNAIASAVTEYGHQREKTQARGEVERLGLFAHELRNLLGAAMLSFHAVKRGTVGINGTTGAVLERSLSSLARVIDRSLSEVRLSVGSLRRDRIRLRAFIEEIEIVAALDAKQRKLSFTVDCTDRDAMMDVDRHLLGSAVSNLLQNAFKFTRADGQVWLRAGARDDRIVIEIEDRCGGLPEQPEHLFRAFEQQGVDQSGLGLGLVICRRAVEAHGGKVTARDLPGDGCVFTIDLPVASGPPPVSIPPRADK
jgi:hypothetical protein